MSYNHLLSAVFREAWAIDPAYANSYMPTVLKMLQGVAPDFEKRQAPDIKLLHPKLGAIEAETQTDAYGNTLPDYDSIPYGSIATFGISGPMIKYGTLCAYGTTEIAGFINHALSHQNIAGILVKLDSGGGAVNAIPPLTSVLANSKKPIVALADMAASAAYFVAVHANHIMAENNLSSSFGSIGVVTNFMSFKKAYELQGIDIHTVYAPESTHKNLPIEKALEGDYELLQSEILSPLAIKFQDTVKKMRGDKLKQDTDGILAGKMFFASDALANGLIDSIGSFDAAIEKIQQLIEVNKFLKT